MRTKLADLSEMIERACDGDERLKARGSITDAMEMGILGGGKTVYIEIESAPWIDPPWEFREVHKEGVEG